jgi:hypothetical protein
MVVPAAWPATLLDALAAGGGKEVVGTSADEREVWVPVPEAAHRLLLGGQAVQERDAGEHVAERLDLDVLLAEARAEQRSAGCRREPPVVGALGAGAHDPAQRRNRDEQHVIPRS